MAAGGYLKAIRDRRWRKIWFKMGMKSSSKCSIKLKEWYEKCLLDLEKAKGFNPLEEGDTYSQSSLENEPEPIPVQQLY